MRITLSNTLLQNVLTFLPLTETGLEVFVAPITIFLSDSYDALEETLTHMKSLFQSIIRIREKFSHGGNKDLRSNFCQRHQYQYRLKKSI